MAVDDPADGEGAHFETSCPTSAIPIVAVLECSAAAEARPQGSLVQLRDELYGHLRRIEEEERMKAGLPPQDEADAETPGPSPSPS